MPLTDKQEERIEMFFKFMEYDKLSDWEDSFVASVGEQYENRGTMTIAQFDKLEEVFERVNKR